MLKTVAARPQDSRGRARILVDDRWMTNDVAYYTN